MFEFDLPIGLVIIIVVVGSLGSFIIGYAHKCEQIPLYNPLDRDETPRFFVNFRTLDGAQMVARMGHGTDGKVFERVHVYNDHQGIQRILATCVWKIGGISGDTMILQGEVDSIKIRDDK